MKHIITNHSGHIFHYCFQNDIIHSIEVIDYLNQQAQRGSVYVAKVKNIVNNINAAFVDIGGCICYYSLIDNPHSIF